jgi:hypothetical protein
MTDAHCELLQVQLAMQVVAAAAGIAVFAAKNPTMLKIKKRRALMPIWLSTLRLLPLKGLPEFQPQLPSPPLDRLEL